MKTREQPYVTEEEVEYVVCDRCGKECDTDDAIPYDLNPTPSLTRRVGKIYTKHWSLSDTPVFPDCVEIESDVRLDVCPECDRAYLSYMGRTALWRVKRWVTDLFR